MYAFVKTGYACVRQGCIIYTECSYKLSWSQVRHILFDVSRELDTRVYA
jgi:hypothetical protein